MRPDLRLVGGSSTLRAKGGGFPHPSPERVPFQLATKPQTGSDPEALWAAFVVAQERSKATLALGDGIAAGKAYAAFLAAFTRPAPKGAA
jgi:hypothetical protein